MSDAAKRDQRPASQAWLQQRERGSVWAMRLMAALAMATGRPLARLLLHPICFYFLLFFPHARHASREYLRRVLDRPVVVADLYRHFFTFATVLLDRVFLIRQKLGYFEINKYGLDVLRDTLAARGSCLFLGAHMGSFELVRFGGARNWDLTINIMMYEANAQKNKQLIESIGGGVRLKVLPIGEVDSLMAAKDRIDAGESLAILGDRDVDGGRMIEVPFLGGRARFPAGPFLVAHALKLPVVLFFGLHTGGDCYDERFELLAEDVSLPRANREQALTDWVCRYAARLEYHCRQAPYNWFNFYDFWTPEEGKNSQ